jgi:hypothetical protein
MANISCSFIGRMGGELEGEVEIPLPGKRRPVPGCPFPV